MSALRRDPERYRRVVLLNTWLPQGDALTRPLEHAAYLAWRTLVTVLGRHSPVQTVFKVMVPRTIDRLLMWLEVTSTFNLITQYFMTHTISYRVFEV